MSLSVDEPCSLLDRPICWWLPRRSRCDPGLLDGWIEPGQPTTADSVLLPFFLLLPRDRPEESPILLQAVRSGLKMHQQHHQPHRHLFSDRQTVGRRGRCSGGGTVALTGVGLPATSSDSKVSNLSLHGLTSSGDVYGWPGRRPRARRQFRPPRRRAVAQPRLPPP
jgi:hypothetical protein